MYPLAEPCFRQARPPAAYWLLPLAVAVLRAIPFLATRLVAPPPDSFFPPFGYNPIDGFAYVGFIRQAAETGDWFLLNPHTTLPQDGRYFLPLFSLLGWVCRLTGLSPFTAFELARVPLIFAFFAVFWRFAGDFTPEPRLRWLAAWLVAFAGGLEILAHATFSWWPARWQHSILTALLDDYGWNVFAAFYNPLWVAGLTLALRALRPILRPAGAAGSAAAGSDSAPAPGTSASGLRTADVPARERMAAASARAGSAKQLVTAAGWRDAGRVAGWTVLTFLVHPYSGLGVLAIGVGVLMVRAVARARWAGDLRLGVGLALALAVLAGFSAWQNQDAVFHATARRFFGPHGLGVWWYPLGLGATGLLAGWGSRQGLRRGMPGVRELLVWVGVAALLHSSPWTSGYHFVYLLPLPLALLAAPALDRLLRVFEEEVAPLRRQFGAALVVALVFQSAPAVTWRSTRLALTRAFPTPVLEAVQTLAREPAGAVFTSPSLGTMLPAWSAHRVVVGHWFLTPDYAAWRDWYDAVMAGRVSLAEVLARLEREQVRWVLLPPRARAELAAGLETAGERRDLAGGYRLFRLP